MTQLVRFDRFELDAESGELFRDGAPTTLPPRAADVLIHLTQHRDRVVGQDELRAKVWGVSALSPSAIPTCISALRHALNDDHADPRIIQTVRGRGYRFIAPIARAQSPHRRDTESLFVGRNHERSILASEIAAARGNSGRVVVLYGEGGIGKTRLIEEFVASQRNNATDVVFVRTPETGAAPALWPWTCALRELAAPGIASLNWHPSVQRLIAPTGTNRQSRSQAGVGPIANGERRFELFSAVSRSLRECANEAPLVIAIDDLHRADASSIGLLRHVLEDLHDAAIIVVATMRDLSPPITPGGAIDVLNHARCRCVHLGPLTRSESDDLIRARTARADETARSTIFDRAGGNPLLILKLADSASLTDAPDRVAGGIPIDVRGATSRLTGRLTPVSIRALSVASVVGRRFLASITSAALDMTRSEFDAAVEPAEQQGLVIRSPGNPDELSFAHLLVRDALYEAIPPRERATLHLAVARALEHHHWPEVASLAAELEHHYFQALHIGGASKVVEFASLAAMHSRSCGALEDVPGHLRRSITAASYCDRVTAPELCGLNVELGEAEIVAGFRERGRVVLLDSFRMAERNNSPEIAARAALSLAPGSLAIEVGVYDPELVQVLEAALATSSGLSDTTGARLKARLALALSWAGCEKRRHDIALEALTIARHLGDPYTLGLALVAEHSVLGGPTNLPRRIELTDELSIAAAQCRNPDLALMHRLLRVSAMLESGRIRALDSEIELFEADASTAGLPHFSWYTDMYRAMRSQMSGDRAAAAAFAESFLHDGSKIGDENAGHSFGVHCALQMWETNRPREAATVGEKFVRRFPNVPAWNAAVAVFEHDAGDVAAAGRRLRRISLDFGDLPRNQIWTTNLAILAEACARVGDENMASSLYGMLEKGAGQFAPLGFAVASLGPISRHLGLLAAAMMDFERAIHHLDRAREDEVAAGGIPWLARTEFDLAKAITSSARVNKSIRATRLFSSARQLATHAGMTTLVRQIDRFARRHP